MEWPLQLRQNITCLSLTTDTPTTEHGCSYFQFPRQGYRESLSQIRWALNQDGCLFNEPITWWRGLLPNNPTRHIKALKGYWFYTTWIIFVSILHHFRNRNRNVITVITLNLWVCANQLSLELCIFCQHHCNYNGMYDEILFSYGTLTILHIRHTLYQWVSEWFSLTAFLRTADIEVHIVHTSHIVIAYTLKSLSSLT